MNFDFLDLVLEADDEEKKEDEKKETKKEDEEKDDKSKDKKDDEKKESDDDINDIIDDDSSDGTDDFDSDIDSDDSKSSEDDDEFNDLIDDSDTDFMSDDDDDIEDDISSSDDDMNDIIGDSDTKVSAVVITTGGNGNVYDKIAKLGYLYTVIANNMKHIHLNCSGRKFNEIHNETENYYYHFSNLADRWFEVAAESPITKLDNPTRAKEHIEDIEVEDKENYTFEVAFGAISINFNKAIDYCKDVRATAGDARSDIQSAMDEELTYLNKQYGFIIRKKMIPESASSDFADKVIASNESFNWLF